MRTGTQFSAICKIVESLFELSFNAISCRECIKAPVIITKNLCRVVTGFCCDSEIVLSIIEGFKPLTTN